MFEEKKSTWTIPPETYKTVLRDYFASQALDYALRFHTDLSSCISLAYRIADLMLAARDQEGAEEEKK